VVQYKLARCTRRIQPTP